MKNAIQYQIITAGSMTGTTAITSSVTNIKYMDNIGFQLIWTGTPNGGAVVQVSENYSQDVSGKVSNAGTWTTLTVSANAAPAGSASSFFYNDAALKGLAASWIRLVYTNTSSTGTLNAFICGKAV